MLAQQARQHRRRHGRGKAASRDLLRSSPSPGHVDSVAEGTKLDEAAGRERERVGGDLAHRDGDHGREVRRPVGHVRIDVAGGGDDVGAAEIGLVDPLLVEREEAVLAGTAKAAVEDVVAAIERLERRFAHEGAPRASVGAEHAKAADHGAGSESMNDARHRRAVTIEITRRVIGAAHMPSVAVDRDAVTELHRVQRGMGRVEAGVQHGDAHRATIALCDGSCSVVDSDVRSAMRVAHGRVATLRRAA